MNISFANLCLLRSMTDFSLIIPAYSSFQYLDIRKTSVSRSFSSFLSTNSIIGVLIKNSYFKQYLSSVIVLNQQEIKYKESFTRTLELDDGVISIDYCVFVGCTSNLNGAGCNIVSQGNVSITNSFFESCRTNAKGGAIYAKINTFIMKSNCFYLCRCGTPNGSDGSTVYAEATNMINSSLLTCHQCPKHGDMCWYGILNLWHGELSSEYINISSSEVEFVAGLAHCQPRNKKSLIKYYMSVNGKTGNSLTFVNMRFIGQHQYGLIVNNSVKSGLIYFQDSHTVLKEYHSFKIMGPLHICVLGRVMVCSRTAYLILILKKELDLIRQSAAQ